MMNHGSYEHRDSGMLALRRIAWLTLFGAAGLAGCKSGSSTTSQIEVTVHSDTALTLNSITIEASADGKQPLPKTLPAAKDVHWTIQIPELNSSLMATLTARGQGTNVNVTNVAVVRLTPGQTVVAELWLDATCADGKGPSCGADQTCRGGRCIVRPIFGGGVGTGGVSGAGTGGVSGTGTGGVSGTGTGGASGTGTGGNGTTGTGGNATGSGGTVTDGGMPGTGGMPAVDAACGSPTDPRNCGSCGHDCTALPNVKPGAAVQCTAGACTVPPAGCAAGFAHCSVRADDGCETSLLDAKNCGACGIKCAAPTGLCGSTTLGAAACTSSCATTAPDLCGSSCVDLKSDPGNCGTCGHSCATLPNVKSGAPGITCQNRLCVIPPAACATGFGHCSTNADDGCETDLTRPATCGSCTKACVTPTALCSTTSGAPACSSSCLAAAPDLCTTKCVNLKTDPKNCGTCGKDCSALPNVKPGATVQCTAGACVIPSTSCATGFAHCSTKADDGCETDISKPANCGVCGKTCTAPTGLCSSTSGTTACSSSCTTPTPDLCTTRCVDLKTDPKNCGTCGKDCGALPNVRAGATVQCAAGACVIPPASCITGFAHCSTKADDGCETSLRVPATCGTCTTTCVAPTGLCSTATGTPTCSSSCTTPNPDLCGTQCVNKLTDPANCGTCGRNCAALAHLKAGAVVQCVNGGCVVPPAACATGFGNCVAPANDTDGCETTVSTNTNCGSCGNTCGSNQTCNGTSCACTGTTRACPGMSGCFAESASSCGASCIACPVATNGSYACVGGGCALTCASTFLKCDSAPATCKTASWTFESNTAEGFAILDMDSPGSALMGFSVSSANSSPSGGKSLAVATQFGRSCNKRIFTLGVRPCDFNTSDLRGKTFSFKLYISSPTPLWDGDKDFVAQVLTSNGLITRPITPTLNTWLTISVPLGTGADAGSVQLLEFIAYMVPTGPAAEGSACKDWDGTFYFDSFAVN